MYLCGMNTATFVAFCDELEKIAESPSREANNFFGLPLAPLKRGARKYDQGAESNSGYRQQSTMAGDPSPSLDMTDRVSNPSQGPGGV